MSSDEEFADICRDYAEIVNEIGRKERTHGRPSAVLADLLQLQSELEKDIVEKVTEAGKRATAHD